MAYVYHFHACRQELVGSITHYDGLLTRERPIVELEDYDAVKQAIADWAEPKLPTKGLTIQSLSLLHTTE